MCGIAGVLRVTPSGKEPEPIPESWLDTLDRSVAHRGPDGRGRFRDSVLKPDGTRVEVALVHRRLSIIDHAGGVQPMVSTRGMPVGHPELGAFEGPVAVVFNGCIYNHRELRAELERAGRVFVTDHSDTEVLIHGYREWGPKLIGRLDGMFAAALWDADAGAVTLFRDLFGEKPLYWRCSPEGNGRTVAFASVPGSLARLHGLGERGFEPHDVIDGEAGALWFASGFSANAVPYFDVEQVPAGRAVFINGTEQPDAYGVEAISPFPSVPRHNEAPAPAPGPLAVDELAGLLENAVASRLDADVTVGTFLSGGIDSSLVTLFASRHHGGIVPVTVRMPDARYDESAHAQRVARHLGLPLEVVECGGLRAADDLVSLIGDMEQPFADSSLLPTFWLCRAASKSMKVALSGDGGDELFFGYDRYLAVRPLRRWSWLLRLIPPGILDRRDPKSRSDRLARMIDAARGAGWPELGAIFALSDRQRLIRNTDWHGLATPWAADSSEDWARRLDVVSYLPGDLLRKVDAASLSAGVEVRCPFLEPKLARRALAAPYAHHTRRGRTPKALLRELAARHLPPDIVNRPKQGFAVPISEWMRTDFGGLRTLLLDVLASREPFGEVGAALDIDLGAVRAMVDEHMQHRRDHGQRLYALMVLGVWARGVASNTPSA